MYRLNFSFLTRYAGMLFDGFCTTLIIAVTSLFFSFILGMMFALMRQSKNRVLRGIATVWVNVLRNTPFLVQLFFFFYGLPQLGIDTSPLAVSIIALSINGSAGNCEVIRSGLMAVKKGYYECSYALGFSKIQTMTTVILPISLRLSFKALTNNFVNLILSSSTCFAATTNEIMGTAKTLAAGTSRPFEVYLMILFLYCIITFTISILCKLVDRKISIKL